MCRAMYLYADKCSLVNHNTVGADLRVEFIVLTLQLDKLLLVVVDELLDGILRAGAEHRHAG